MSDNALRELAQTAKAWPFEEARKVLKRINNKTPEKGYVLFQTGYGPSGLPHIGTFGEVQRTTMVRRAFELLSDIPTKLIAFSDDMDGFRKVPTNLPNQEMLAEYLHKPLTKVPDPFGTHESFAHHNNARLCDFLDSYGFEYEFASASDYYTSGKFDEALIRVLEVYDRIMGIMLPTLGEERRQTYSPFLPICEETGNVLQVPVLHTDAKAGTIVYKREDGQEVETLVTGGRTKLQWKPDWAMRQWALGVDYEMSGKDLIDSVKASSSIVRAMGGNPPQTLTYELFLDGEGTKISKSKGNGLSMEEWLTYATPESLSLFMYQKPKTAKRLYFDVIPKNVDEYYSHLSSFEGMEDAKKLENPVWHIHNGNPPKANMPLSFNILLNLASVCNTDDKSVLWGFISRYAPDASPESHKQLDDLVGYAIRYYTDFVKPHKNYRAPSDKEREAFTALRNKLDEMDVDTPSDEVQSSVFAIGKEFEYENLREWFKANYEVLLGQEQGPRMGSFIALYGIKETVALIDQALSAEGLAG
ncbi:lysine--tRNA ligase [Curvivirga sp.]|uniref:lysine--tRNA ligase n=1 Tax=Curvivirga sp. TaxID=2856848 RepID=UPI003B5BB98B